MEKKLSLPIILAMGAFILFLSASLVLEKEKNEIPNANSEELATIASEEEKNGEGNSDSTVQEEALMQSNTASLLTELLVRLENQEKVDAQIQAEVESGYYTPENPLVILDPYTQSPLTALICFTTEQPTRVDIHVEGEDEYTEVNHSFEELTNQHIIPVYGLYPDKLNPVTVMVYDENGEELARNISEIQTEPVSDHFETMIILTETFQENYDEGINFMQEGGKIAFDKEGDIRWYFSKTNLFGENEYFYKDNHFLIGLGGYGGQIAFFGETDKLGKLYNIYYSPHGSHHDAVVTDTSFIVLGHSPGETIEDFIYEVDIVSGEITNTLDVNYVLQRTRPAWNAGLTESSPYTQNWAHLNSVDYDPESQSILISSNDQSAVVKMHWPSGEIQWILGGHEDWLPRLQQYLLTPIGEDFEWHYNQHDASILPDYDNNPNTIDILLFDNGSTRFVRNLELQRQIRNNEIVEPELYSRLVHYRVNQVTMEVEQIWQYGKERGLDLFSCWKSGVSLLENGNILGTFTRELNEGTHPVLSEVTKENELIWEAEIFSSKANGHKGIYRAERLPFYFDDDAYHDIYSTARNLIPDDVMVWAFGGEYLINSGKMERKELFSHSSVSAEKTPDHLLIYREEFSISGDTYYQLSFSLSEEDIAAIEFMNIDLYDGPDYDFPVNEVHINDVTERIEVTINSDDISGVSDCTAEIRVMITVNGEQESITLTDFTFGKYE